MDIAFRGVGESLEVMLKNFVPISDIQNVSDEWGKRLCHWVAQQFPAMPGSLKECTPLPELFLKSSFGRERVCFYGGSFNPWHRGHLACLELCPEENILVVPDRNPWKDSRNWSWDDYVNLCHALRETSCSVYPGFLYGEGNPTVDWLPQTEFKEKCLLLGADNFLSLEGWKEYLRLIDSLDVLYVVPRGDRDYEEITAHLTEASPNLEIVILPRHPYEGLASSEKCS